MRRARMRVLFCTTGGLGHLLPLRPLATALRRRGHAIGWVTAPDALPELDGLGFELFAAGPGFDISRRQFRAAHMDAAQLTGEQLSAYTFPRLFGGVLAPAMLDAVENAVRHWSPDLVVHEPAALAAPLVCAQFGLRNVTHGYGLRPPGPYLEGAMDFFGSHWRTRGLEVPLDGGLYRHLYLDVAPASLQRPLQSSAEGVLRFNPYRADAADASALPGSLSAALQSPARQGPRIYVTFGTVFNRSPVLVAAARAAARLGGIMIVTVGADGDLEPLRTLDGPVSVHRFLDQAALFPHCDLVVSHGGAGTVLGAAAHGVPQLVLPQAADHFRNARALCSVHAGRTVEPDQQTTEGIGAAMADVLGSTAQIAAASSLAREMAAMSDVAAAACSLEDW